MSVRRLLSGKGNFVPVIRSDLALSDVIDQLQIDEAGALVVTDDKSTILGIVTDARYCPRSQAPWPRRRG